MQILDKEGRVIESESTRKKHEALCKALIKIDHYPSKDDGTIIGFIDRAMIHLEMQDLALLKLGKVPKVRVPETLRQWWRDNYQFRNDAPGSYFKEYSKLLKEVKRKVKNREKRKRNSA